MNIFAKRLCIALEEKGMRAADLAEKTGIGKSAISQYMSGAFKPKQVRTEKIAMALDVPVSYLMGWTDDPNINRENKKPVPVVGFKLKSEAEIIDAYNAADKKTKSAVRMLLELPTEENVGSALIAARGGGVKDIESTPSLDHAIEELDKKGSEKPTGF